MIRPEALKNLALNRAPPQANKVQIHFLVEREWRDIADGLRAIGLLPNLTEELQRLYKDLIREKISEVTPDSGLPSSFYEMVSLLKDELVQQSEKQVSVLSAIADQAYIIEEQERLAGERLARASTEFEEWRVKALEGEADKENLVNLYSNLVLRFVPDNLIKQVMITGFNRSHYYLHQYFYLLLLKEIEERNPEAADQFIQLIKHIVENYGEENFDLFLTTVAQVVIAKYKNRSVQKTH